MSVLDDLTPAQMEPWTQPWPGSDLPPRELLTALAMPVWTLVWLPHPPILDFAAHY